MIELVWVLSAWAVVAGVIVVWCGDELAVHEGPWGRRLDRTACACCRHDAIAHAQVGPGICTQCPCGGFRSTC